MFAPRSYADRADPSAFEYSSGSFTEFIGQEDLDATSDSIPAQSAGLGSRRGDSGRGTHASSRRGAGNAITSPRHAGLPLRDPSARREDPASGAHRAVPPPRPPRPGRDLFANVRLVAAVVGLLAIAAVGALALNRHGSPSKANSPLPSVGPATSGSGLASASPSPSASLARWSAPTHVGGAAITGLSCPRTSACYAVDTAGTVWFGAGRGAWRVVATNPNAPLEAIACPAVWKCMALDRTGYALIKVGRTWRSPLYIDSRGSAFSSVSCPTTSFCMTADSGGNAFSDTGGTWHPFTVDPQGAALTGLACASASHCFAVSARGVVFTYDAGAWSGPASVDTGHSFTGVSCASATFCMAVDDAGNAAVYRGGGWHVAPIGIRAYAVACPARGICVATGRAGKAAVYESGRWTVAATRVHRTVGQLSCPRVNSCVAADLRDVMTYHK